MSGRSSVHVVACHLPPDGLVFADMVMPASGRYRRTHVMIHGGMHSGACWMATPDGRPGWAVTLAEQDDRAICLDWPGVGRSGHVAMDDLTGAFVAERIAAVMARLDGELVLWTHSMSGPLGWKIAEHLGDRLATLVAVAPGPPGNIQPVAPVLGDRDDILTVSLFGRPWHLPKREPLAPSREFAWFKFVETSAQFPVEMFEGYLAGLLAIPPRLIFERLNVDGSQLRLDDPARLRRTKVVVVTGENDPDHPKDADAGIVAYLAEAGVAAEFRYLPEHGIRGNGHMMMLERNNMEVLRSITERI